MASELKKVGFYGAEGSYSHLAALEYFDEKRCSFTAVTSLEELFSKTEEGEFDEAIVPLENSISGSIHEVYSFLWKHKLFIIGEQPRSEEHCLCVAPGTKLSDIKVVLSHPHILKQCGLCLEKLGQDNHTKIRRIEMESTSLSAKMIADSKDPEQAAICSEIAAKIHGLEILQRNIADMDRVVTRYVVLGREPYQPSADGTKTKTSIAIVLHNQPQALYKALSCFALRDINVAKVEAQPASVARLMPGFDWTRAFKWQFIFYIDFEAISQKQLDNAMSNLEEFCISVRLWGSYQQNLPVAITSSPKNWACFV